MVAVTPKFGTSIPLKLAFGFAPHDPFVREFLRDQEDAALNEVDPRAHQSRKRIERDLAQILWHAIRSCELDTVCVLRT